jgi:hypothetical protein
LHEKTQSTPKQLLLLHDHATPNDHHNKTSITAPHHLNQSKKQSGSSTLAEIKAKRNGKKIAGNGARRNKHKQRQKNLRSAVLKPPPPTVSPRNEGREEVGNKTKMERNKTVLKT